MKKKWLNYLYISGMLLLVSCTQKSALDKTLSSAKENRSELQKVLKHYANDSLKLEAAKFLISNMQGSYANDSNLQTVYAPFYKIYDNVRKKYNYEINKKCGEEIDSLWQVFCFVYSDELMAKNRNDAEHLKASTIISEIEMAFKAWKGNVYTQNCSFHEFCEYILPYRRENGLVIDNSRDRYYQRHHKDFYATHGKNVMEKTDSLLFLYKDIVHSPYYVPFIPILTASTFEKIKTGTCEQRCWFNSLLLSSVGMAAAVDFVPVWGNRNGGHSWNVIIVNGESYAFEPQRDRHDGATLCGPCQLYGGTGQRCVPTGGGKYGAVYRSMRSAAAGAQSGTGFGATGERLKKYLLGRGLPHNLFAAHGFAGGKPCTALESIVCPKRPCERNFWHPLSLYGHGCCVLGADRYLSVEKHRL